MKVLAFVLTCIVLVAAIAWHQGRTPDSPGNMTDKPAELDRERTLNVKAPSETRREERERQAAPVVAGATDLPAAKEQQFVTSTYSPVMDQATGAAGSPSVENDVTASAGAGISSADGKVDPATGVLVSPQSPDYTTATVSAGVRPPDGETDPATGVAIAR